MIQRIQSIYLLLASLAIGSTGVLPLATASGDTAALAATGDNFFADGVYKVLEFPAGWMILLSAVLIAALIFRYKDRVKQMRSVGFGIILVLVSALMLGLLGYHYATQLPPGTAPHLALGSAAWPVAILLLYLAYRAIGKDEALVRSSDRLR